MQTALSTYIQHLTYGALTISQYNAATSTYHSQLAAYVLEHGGDTSTLDTNTITCQLGA